MKPIWKHTIVAAFAGMVIGYLIVGIHLSHLGEQDRIYEGLQINIEDEDQRQFVTESEILHRLEDKNLNPTSQPIDFVSLQDIEQSVAKHDMVRSVECYTTADRRVIVSLTQRIPVLRVKNGAETYLVDDQRERMPARASITVPMLVATGAVSEQRAKHELSDLAQWVQKDSFWNERLERVHVVHPKMAYLYQKDGGPMIILGDFVGFDNKLNRMHHWLTAVGQGIDVNQYKAVDLRFEGQVIGIKQEYAKENQKTTGGGSASGSD